MADDIFPLLNLAIGDVGLIVLLIQVFLIRAVDIEVFISGILLHPIKELVQS